MHDVFSHGFGNTPRNDTPVLIWTRAAADLPADKTLLNALPMDVLHIPCIGIEALARPTGIAELSGQNLKKVRPRLAFSSQNAVKICASWKQADPEAFSALTGCTGIFAHGRKTADLAEKLFAQPVHCVDSPTSEGLAAALISAANSDSIPVLWFCGEEVAFDLAANLKMNGITCKRIPIYRTATHPTDVDGCRLSAEASAELKSKLVMRLAGSKAAICFASPSAVAGWLELAGKEAGLAPKFFLAAVIGPTTARAAAQAGFYPITSCAWPQLADLADLGAQLARAANSR